MLLRLKQLITFGSVGIVNSLIDYVIFIVLTTIGISPLIANVISFSCGATNSYLINRSVTFRVSANHSLPTIIRFMGVTMIGLAISQLTLWAGIKADLNAAQSKVISIVATFLISFTLTKLFVFEER